MKQFNIGDTAILIAPINDYDNGYFRRIGDKVIITKIQDNGDIVANIGHVDYVLHPDMLVTMHMWKGIYNTVSDDIGNSLKRLR